MTPLRQRMIEDMQVRNLSARTTRTIDCYVRQVAAFARHFKRSPELLGLDEIRAYQIHLVHERKLSWSSFIRRSAPCTSLYGRTLGKDWNIEHNPFAKRPRKLPLVLSQHEVHAVLEAITAPQNRVIAMTLYAAGLRVSEAVAPENRRHRQQAHADACRSRQGPQGSFGDLVAAASSQAALPLQTLPAPRLAVPAERIPTGTSPRTRLRTPSPPFATSSPASP